jgi:hypothetical protein
LHLARSLHAQRARLVLALPHGKEGQVKIVSRRQWGARKPKDRTYQDPRSVREVFLHYSESPSASTFEAQRKAMQGLQDFHMDGRGWSDIAYNYLVFNGPRPRAFYGRGARVVPAAQANHNTNTIAVCVVTCAARSSNATHPSSRTARSHRRPALATSSGRSSRSTTEEGSMKPVPKVAAAGIGGAVATIVVYIASQVGVEIPGDVGAAIATVVAFAAAYLKP